MDASAGGILYHEPFICWVKGERNRWYNEDTTVIFGRRIRGWSENWELPDAGLPAVYALKMRRAMDVIQEHVRTKNSAKSGYVQWIKNRTLLWVQWKMQKRVIRENQAVWLYRVCQKIWWRISSGLPWKEWAKRDHLSSWGHKRRLRWVWGCGKPDRLH